MDYLFLFLISTGFVGGVFCGLKKSVKALFCLILTFAIFALIFVPIKDFLCNEAILKNEFISFVEEKTQNINILGKEYLSREELLSSINDLALPDFLKGLLENFCKAESLSRFSLASAIGEGCYVLILIILLAIVLLIALSLIVNICLSFVLMKAKLNKEMFVTKRFISGGVGVMRGVVIFIGIEIALLFLGEVLNIVAVKDFVSSSSMGKIGFDFLNSSVSMFVDGIF